MKMDRYFWRKRLLLYWGYRACASAQHRTREFPMSSTGFAHETEVSYAKGGVRLKYTSTRCQGNSADQRPENPRLAIVGKEAAPPFIGYGEPGREGRRNPEIFLYLIYNGYVRVEP